MFSSLAIAAAAAIKNIDKTIVRIRPVGERNCGGGDWVGYGDSEGEAVCCGVAELAGWGGAIVGVGVVVGSFVGSGVGVGGGDGEGFVVGVAVLMAKCASEETERVTYRPVSML